MRPSNLIYSVDERPPAWICMVNAAQQLTVFAPVLIFTILVMTGAGASAEAVGNAVSLTLVTCGVGVMLQAFPGRWTGSGYLISVSPAAPYIPISISAITAGGLPLLSGMIMLAGLFEIAFAQVVRRFRAFFPAEISGLCILLIGVFLGLVGVRAAFGLDPETLRSTASRTELIITGGTLALMIGLNLWGRGLLRMLCAIIGVICGYGAAVLLGATDPESMRGLAAAPWFALPAWAPSLPTVAPEMLIPFLAAALICSLRAMGDVSVAQKINDRDWVRPDMVSIRNGIVSNGLATLFAGLAGVIGSNTQSSGIGISNATGVTSRWVAYWMGGILIALSAVPVVAMVLVAMPRSVTGAMLLFTASFIMISGLQVITSRLLDARRTFIIGIALTFSLSRDIFPLAYADAPPVLQPFLSSGLVLGLLTALGLNALFRIGMRTGATVTIEPSAEAQETIRGFLEGQGAKWGARRDVIERAIFGTEQSLESILAHCDVQGPVTLDAAFDEFNLDIRIGYQGEDFVLADRRPTEEQILESEDGLRLLTGYLIQRNADRVRASRKGDRAIVEFHFQH